MKVWEAARPVMAAEYGRSIWEQRDKEGNNGHEDLLVFGYSCKLFRDNDKALYLDKGNHLIPWMGDNNVMVDRYDVRGALYDLSEAESGGGGDRWEGLTEEERAEEERCDYERYLALYHDEFQYQAFQDEEAKRLMAELGSDTYTYSQVGFNYDGQAMVGDMTAVSGEQGPEYFENHHLQQGDQQQQQQEQQEQQNTGYMPEADEDTYVPPTELNVPQGMVVPETIKQNKIIVKTSKFIVAQGGQMEIIIKTKQADNPMFGFLSFDNPLNAYYKHMVAMIKSGRYTPAEEVDQGRSRKDSDGNGDQYLHPSLSAGIKPDLAPGTPTSALKPSSDCAYFKLIHKIKEKQKNTPVVESRESPAPASPGVVVTSTPIAEGSETPTMEKKTEDKASIRPKVKRLVDYPSFNRTKDYDSDSDEGSEASPTASKGTSEYSNIKWPPPDVQMVIDKMASYIIKNGVEFETMVRSRDDPRFSFLKKDHEYYPYYRCKIRLYNEVYGDIFKDGVEDKVSTLSSLVEGGSSTRKEKRGGNSNSSSSSNSSRSSNNNNNNKQTSTISFSIKSREQDVNLDRHSTFPVESSSSDDEDMDEEEKEKRRLEREERRRKRKIKEKEERERREREEKERKEREEKEKEKEKEKDAEKMEESTDASGDNDDMYDIFKYAQEMDKDMDAEERSHREKVLNEEHGKESSRPASDGTVQSECKQQERRKKAAMFLSRLKKGSKEEESTAQPVYGPQLPPEIAAQILNSASQSPRSSIASTRHSTPSRSRSHSTSPGPGVPMPPKEAPAPPPPPPPTQSPPAPPIGLEMTETYRANKIETSTNNISKSDWTSIPEPPANTETVEHVKSAAPKESSVLSGASEDGRRSQSLESRRSKSRPIEVPHREKTRSRKKQRHGRSESRSPSSRRERKKRKRSRSRSRRHKKRRSRSRSPKSHKSSHKKKRRKHSSRHEREGRERKSKKSRRRSVSSSSSDSSSHSYSSSRSTSPSDNDVQVIESPGHSKRGSRASSVISVGASDLSHLSSALGRITEECTSPPPPLPPIPPSPTAASLLSTVEEKAGNSDNVLEVSGGGGEETKEEKKEEKKPLFDPHNSAAMAKIAQGLRAKVHALLNKESKL